MHARNQFLLDLGLKHKEYGSDFKPSWYCFKRRFELWKQRRKYGFDGTECYSLDHTFIEWLYSHIKMYIQEAENTIILDGIEEYESFFLDGKKYSQRQAMEYILKRCEDYLTVDKYLENIDFTGDKMPNKLSDLSQEQIDNFDFYNQKEREAYAGMRDAIRMWAELFPAMWW